MTNFAPTFARLPCWKGKIWIRSHSCRLSHRVQNQDSSRPVSVLVNWWCWTLGTVAILKRGRVWKLTEDFPLKYGVTPYWTQCRLGRAPVFVLFRSDTIFLPNMQSWCLGVWCLRCNLASMFVSNVTCLAGFLYVIWFSILFRRLYL